MRIVTSALIALLCTPVAAVAPPAAAQQAPAKRLPVQPAPAPRPAPDQPDAPAQSEDGGAGYLPGARFQRELGGPGFVCTATNALRDQQCTASCQAGETADCVDAEGSGAPSCGCTKE